MQPIIYKLRLDASKAGSQASICVKQGDVRSRQLSIFLYNGSVPYEISSNVTVVLKAIKPDGTVIFDDCEVDGNIIKRLLPQQMFAVPGTVECELTLYGTSETLSSPRFDIYVGDQLLTDDEITSTSEFGALATALAVANEYKKLWSNPSASAVGGDAPSATITFTEDGVIFNFVLEKGEKGDTGADGAPGADGVSPTIVENAGNSDTEYRLDITDADGTIITPNLMGSAGSAKDMTVTFLAAEWEEDDEASYAQTLAVEGISGDMAPIAGLLLSDVKETAITEKTEAQKVDKLLTGDGEITGVCLTEAPVIDLNFQLKVIGTSASEPDVPDEPSLTNVFGVEWNFADSSTALTRLTTASDPNGVVNVDITTEPVAAIGDGAGSSPFDAYMPWSGMTEFNVIDNALSYQKGEEGFSRTDYDTVVRIPKFWYKVETDEESSKMRFYIADGPADGFAVHGAFDRGDGVVRDNVYVGRYMTSYYTKYASVSLANQTSYVLLVGAARPNQRTNLHNKGAAWWLYDYALRSALQLLYLIEFADWNSNAKVGLGNGGDELNPGGTDSMAYHTGRAAGTDGETQIQYRCIEDIWGNCSEWVDGINALDDVIYLCTNPEHFADGTSANYVESGLVGTGPYTAFIKKISASPALPWALLPTEQGGNASSYISDTATYGSTATDGYEWHAGVVGGSGGSTGGMFRFGTYGAEANFEGSNGSRLMFLP